GAERTTQGPADRRDDEHCISEIRQDLYRNPAEHVEGVAGLPRRGRCGTVSVEAFRRGVLRIPQQDTWRTAGAAATMETRGGVRRPYDWRVGRPHLRRALLPTRGQG